MGEGNMEKKGMLHHRVHIPRHLLNLVSVAKEYGEPVWASVDVEVRTDGNFYLHGKKPKLPVWKELQKIIGEVADP